MITELARKHGALLYNDGHWDEHFVITKEALQALVCEVTITATTNERNACALLIKELLKDFE